MESRIMERIYTVHELERQNAEPQTILSRIVHIAQDP